MRVKCVLCDKIEQLDDFSPLAKKLRNRPIHTFMCASCQARITDRAGNREDKPRTKKKHTPHPK